MLHALKLLLLLLAVVLFVLGGLNVAAPRFSLVAFGLAAWVSTYIIDLFE